MIKKNWKLLLVTSAAILLPVLVGLALWNQLPDQMPTHWNASGETDGWSSKPFAVFGLPLILEALHWLGVLATASDPKKTNHSDKVLQLMLWITPVISVLLGIVSYGAALGKAMKVELVLPLFMGILFVAIGNYMPKCKQNYTIGIKIAWTLNSEENWNRTHRFAGWVWVACGFGLMLTGLLGSVWVVLALMLAATLAPVIYSYILHRKGI